MCYSASADAQRRTPTIQHHKSRYRDKVRGVRVWNSGLVCSKSKGVHLQRCNKGPFCPTGILDKLARSI
eukprot:1107654-Amphidinium_carterae.1